MKVWWLVWGLVVLLLGPAWSFAAGNGEIVLPNGWILNPPRGAEVQTGTMPQGMAISPDGTTIAVVESGYNPPTLGLYRLPGLAHLAAIPLPGAFGRPLWIDAGHVLVAGANADALLDVDVQSQRLTRIALPKGSYPVLVAAEPGSGTFAVATDGDGAVRIGTLATIAQAPAISVGAHPSALAFDAGGTNVFVTSRTASSLVRIDVASHALQRRTTGLHPSALGVIGNQVYVAQSDADSVGIYDANDLHLVKNVALGDGSAASGATGVSPNAVSAAGDRVFVSLGGANSVAVLLKGRLAGRVEAGWYPTDVLEVRGTLYVLDGKGEGARPNPNYSVHGRDERDYIGAIEYGSLRAYTLPSKPPAQGSPQGSSGWRGGVTNALLTPSGPIRHVFFVLKENRTYDQVLGDVRAGNGDAALTWFGDDVTPNQHALAARFGLFDNAYSSGEVSDPGHMWSDAGFANDYVERWWPVIYGDRRQLDDLSGSGETRVPSGGFLWDAAQRAHVSFRDYGEQVASLLPQGPWVAAVPSLKGRIDPLYAGWNLDYSDLDRVKEWRREFGELVAKGTLPQFEFIWLPGDHTYGSTVGKLTPTSYVAINDYALGQMVETLSHSPVWKSSAMFVIEDDAQNGPDHVSDQRTTLYLVSPYARSGVRHEHYATVSVLRTIEAILGMRPLSTYDAMAVPMNAAFGKADMRPYVAIAPKVDVTRRNTKVAYGASASARLDFSRPDAAPAQILNDILAHNH